jgi:hypothetical protein
MHQSTRIDTFLTLRTATALGIKIASAIPQDAHEVNNETT